MVVRRAVQCFAAFAKYNRKYNRKCNTNPSRNLRATLGMSADGRTESAVKGGRKHVLRRCLAQLDSGLRQSSWTRTQAICIIFGTEGCRFESCRVHGNAEHRPRVRLAAPVGRRGLLMGVPGMIPRAVPRKRRGGRWQARHAQGLSERH